MHLHIAHSAQLSVEHRAVELVERKGIGHPDTLCDRAAEELSIALSRHYLERFGAILHHNTDKVLLVGGQAQARFGGGEIIDPLYLLLSGRATARVGDAVVPLGALAVETTTAWLRETLPHLPLPGGLIIDYRLNPSSPDLVALFRQPGVPLANDTSFAVAFAPLSELEQLVKTAEAALNSAAWQQCYPSLGQDIKVMGVRTGERIRLLVAAAFVASATPDLETYLEVKRALEARLLALAGGITRREVTVHLNGADRPEAQVVFLTVTGTSAEQGDDGQVGRGNRATGLITPMRPMTLEAAAGKNPVSHVGKLYQVYAQQIVDRICAEIPEVRAASCALLARIGQPITDPQAAAVRVESALADAVLHDPITAIVRDVLAAWSETRDGFLERRWTLF